MESREKAHISPFIPANSLEREKTGVRIAAVYTKVSCLFSTDAKASDFLNLDN